MRATLRKGDTIYAGKATPLFEGRVCPTGDEIYNRDIRSLVETEQNKGKFIAIDIETGAWEMDADEMIAGDHLFARVPDAQTWMVRVGYPYVYRFGSGPLSH